MSSDPPIPNHHDEERISRRDLGRYAALSAVAAAISGKAAAQHTPTPSGPIVKASRTMNGTAGCQLFLDLLPRKTTVADLIYGDFCIVLDGLADKAVEDPKDPATYRPDLAAGLRAFSKHIKDYLKDPDTEGTVRPVWHFFAYDAGSHPNPKWKTAWREAYGSPRTTTGAAQQRIVDHFRFPFLNLGPNSVDPNDRNDRRKWGPREFISEFVLKKDPLETTKYLVESRIGHIKYHDLFEKPRNHPEVCGPMVRAPEKDDPAWTKFRLIRQAFHHGIFADMSAMSATHAMDQSFMTPQANGLCFSESAQECVPMYNGFCWEMAGGPGAGSTFCE